MTKLKLSAKLSEDDLRSISELRVNATPPKNKEGGKE